MTAKITLRAADLWSKFGFDDGGAMTDIVFAATHESAGLAQAIAKRRVNIHIPFFGHQVLIETVRRHLLPLLPGLEVEEVGTSHNPIRVAGDADEPPAAAREIKVDVTIGQVLDVITDLALEPGEPRGFHEATIVKRVTEIWRRDAIPF